MTIPDHETRLLPPETKVGPCRECQHSMEDHDWDPEALAYVCQVDGCECYDGAEVTLDDYLANEGDRERSFRKEGL